MTEQVLNTLFSVLGNHGRLVENILEVIVCLENFLIVVQYNVPVVFGKEVLCDGMN